MRNDEERKVFENWFISEGLILTDINPYALVAWDAFQAGAAYQRTQAQPADALVEALEQIARLTFDKWTNATVASHIADEALAAYRAAQEKPHD